MIQPDWDSLVWETRGFLGLNEGEPIPRDELVATAESNGWSEREIRDALRATDRLEAAGSIDAVRLVDEEQADDDTPAPRTPDWDATEPAVRRRRDLDLDGVEADTYPAGLVDDGQRWLVWQLHEDRKVPRNPSWGRDREWTGEWSRAGAKDPRAWMDFATADHWTDHDGSLGLAYYLAHPDGADWADDAKYDWVDVDADVPDEPHVGLLDFDDIRDPETGAVHPAAADLLERFGHSFAEWSPSRTGAHVLGRFELPDGVNDLHIDLSTDEWPDAELEIYPGRRYTTVTGLHIPGSGDEVVDVQAAVDDLLDDHDDAVADARDDRDGDGGSDWTDRTRRPREELADLDVTHDYDDVVAAVEQLTHYDLPLTSSYQADENSEVESWDPGYRQSSTGRSLKRFCPNGPWVDMRKKERGFGLLQLWAAERGIIREPWAALEGDDWHAAVDAAREAGAPIPEYEPRSEDLPELLDDALDHDHDDVDGRPTVATPLEHLEHLSHDEQRRAARKRGLDWPTTREARDRLFASITEVMREEDDRVVDAPTSLGKSYSIAATDWGAADLADVTGDRPVVHLSKTRDARDEAIATAAETLDAGDWYALRGRSEACPVCAGGHDPDPDGEPDRQVVTIGGEPASEWLDRVCDGRGIPVSVAHSYLTDHNDQGLDELPCDRDHGECPAIAQWEELRNGDYPLVFATHNFAHVPNLRLATNLVLDERPDYVQDLDQDRIRRAVTAYLREVDAEVRSWEQLLRVSEDGLSPNEHDPRDLGDRYDALHDDLRTDPGREWYLEDPDAHTLAPAIARAVFAAEERANDRRAATVAFEPPRLDAGARDDDGWNREWCSIVLDDANTIRQVRVRPDLSLCRSVVGLDAHPSIPVWQANSLPWIQRREVLDPEARRLWRRFERGLRVIQVGDATRPLASGEYFQREQVAALVEGLREQYGEGFGTAITANSVEGQVASILEDAGVRDPRTMHFGEEKSRNDFANEDVGLVEGCIDPGDDYVLDLLAELDLDAEPETVPTDDGTARARGRGFEGDDAHAADEILASVRENHTAQAAGRYARNADDPDDHATCYVRTDAAPADFVDVQVPGVEWVYSDLQATIVEELRDADGAVTTREVADAVGCSKEHARATLRRLEGEDVVQAFDGGGAHGATLFREDGTPNAGVVDLQGTTSDHVRAPYTWSLAIRDPIDLATTADPGGDDPGQVWDWRANAPTADIDPPDGSG